VGDFLWGGGGGGCRGVEGDNRDKSFLLVTGGWTQPRTGEDGIIDKSLVCRKDYQENFKCNSFKKLEPLKKVSKVSSLKREKRRVEKRAGKQGCDRVLKKCIMKKTRRGTILRKGNNKLQKKAGGKKTQGSEEKTKLLVKWAFQTVPPQKGGA